MNGDTASQVIDFINTQCTQTLTVVTSGTLFSDMGLNEQDTITLIMELEEHFGIPQNPKDAKGITIVSQAIDLIESKI